MCTTREAATSARVPTEHLWRGCRRAPANTAQHVLLTSLSSSSSCTNRPLPPPCCSHQRASPGTGHQSQPNVWTPAPPVLRVCSGMSHRWTGLQNARVSGLFSDFSPAAAALTGVVLRHLLRWQKRGECPFNSPPALRGFGPGMRRLCATVPSAPGRCGLLVGADLSGTCWFVCPSYELRRKPAAGAVRRLLERRSRGQVDRPRSLRFSGILTAN